jgi:hypothetical protein
LILERAVTDGSELSVTLFLREDGIEDPDEETLETVAKVMWSAPRDDGTFMAGLQFGDLAPAQETILDRFLHRVG